MGGIRFATLPPQISNETLRMGDAVNPAAARGWIHENQALLAGIQGQR